MTRDDEQTKRDAFMMGVGFFAGIIIAGAIAGGIMAGIGNNMDAIIETGCNIKELENVLGTE